MARGNSEPQPQPQRKPKPAERHYLARIRTVDGMVLASMSIADFCDALTEFASKPGITGWNREHYEQLKRALATVKRRLGG